MILAALYAVFAFVWLCCGLFLLADQAPKAVESLARLARRVPGVGWFWRMVERRHK